MNSRLILTVCCLASCLTLTAGLKVLVYNTIPGNSHVAFSTRITDILIDAGHMVDTLLVEWNPTVKSNGSERVRRMRRFSLSHESPWISMPHFNKPFEDKVYYPGDNEPTNYRKTLSAFCEEMLDSDVLDWIRAGEYDCALASPYDACSHGMFYLAGIKSVMVYSPTPMIDHWSTMLGLPLLPSYVPNPLRNNGEGDRMSISEKLSVMADRFHQQSHVLPSFHQLQTDAFRRRFGPAFPSVTTLAQRVSAIFVNTHPLLELPRPLSHKVKHVGGITLRKLSPLKPELEKIVRTGKKGAIVFSFGSLAKTSEVPRSVLSTFANVFASFKEYSVIWKYDEDDHSLFHNSSNIFPVKWIQQVELLNDARVKLFISHTGLNSMIESAHSGTPVLSVPLFLDQHYNAQVLERRGVAIRLNKHKITPESLTEAIQTLLENTTYAQSAHTLQRMLQRFPQKPEQTLIEWVAFAAEFDSLSEFWQLASAHMSLWECYCLDVLFLVAASATTLFVVVWKWILRPLLFAPRKMIKLE